MDAMTVTIGHLTFDVASDDELIVTLPEQVHVAPAALEAALAAAA